ncbi:MAG: hypothetical protein EOP83_34275 [Verrucomicrobiaceae bacterium]|nr:MAG: hypothetical protein EOP83_34275 [Verrucomicrobiaceae bacterium]
MTTLLGGAPHYRLNGKLSAFTIKLGDFLEASAKSATIKRENDGPTEFALEGLNVRLGKSLEFLKPLMTLLQGFQAGGFFVRPCLPDKVEAGFEFSQSLITVGTFSIMNFDVLARLTLALNRDKSSFDFRFASAEKPFLISSAPYGGGGYAWLSASGDNGFTPNGSELQFMFGAVVAIKFGPLRGHGRVMTGFLLKQRDGALTIYGLVEAVGEGSIACFSLTISLAVTVWNDPADGSVKGQARYSVRFKVGFASVSYSFTANYTFKGGSGSRTLSMLPEVVRIAPARHTVTTTVPNRNDNWTSYIADFDLGLLGGVN